MINNGFIPNKLKEFLFTHILFITSFSFDTQFMMPQ